MSEDGKQGASADPEPQRNISGGTGGGGSVTAFETKQGNRMKGFGVPFKIHTNTKS